MSKNYQYLKELVKTSQLRIYFIFSIPRSRSQAFQIALTEASEIDGQINSPFCNFDNHPISWDASENKLKTRLFEDGCQRILDRYTVLKSKLKITDRPLVLLVHEHFSNIVSDEIYSLKELSKDFVILFRDPMKQVFSYLVRSLTDKLSIPLQSYLSLSEILKIVSIIENSSLDECREKLSKFEYFFCPSQIFGILNKDLTSKMSMEDIIEAYHIAIGEVNYLLRIIWENFQLYFNILLKISYEKSINLMIVDAEQFIETPEQVLRDTTKRLSGLSYNENMVGNWSKAAGLNFNCCIFQEHIENAWVGPSRASNKLMKEHDVTSSTFNLKDLPRALQETTRYAIKLYQELCKINQLLSKKNENYRVEKLISKKLPLLSDVFQLECWGYWHAYLEGIPVALNLPFDSLQTKISNDAYAEYNINISQLHKQQLLGLADNYESNLSMVFLSILDVLLYRYTNQETISIGLLQYSKLYDLSTPNIILLRSDLTQEIRFCDLLQKVRKTSLDAFSHQAITFNQLRNRLKIVSGINIDELCQVMFIEHNDQYVDFDQSILSKKPCLLVEALEQDNSIKLTFKYLSNLFNADTIKRMIGHFAQLLEEILKEPQMKIGYLPILTKTELHTLLVEWNQTEKNYLSVETIHALFEEQVKKTPNNIALVYEDQQLTYEELNVRANQLAYFLRNLGVARNTLVVLSLERSLELVISLLAILKANGAYVPLDPSYPEERLHMMLEDTGSKILLTHSSLQHLFKKRSIAIDQIDISNLPIINPISTTQSEDLAYVIYTSGSTGKPKGVMVEHRGVVNCIFSIKERVNINNDDVHLAVTSVSFDVSALDYYLPFATGSKVIIASQKSVRDPYQLISLIKKYNINVMQATPATGRMLVDASWKQKDQFKILLAGEALPKNLAEELSIRAEVYNIYGPTETTIYATFCKISAIDNITIGKPLSNFKIYILDSYQQLVPIGIPGELYIGGIGVAKGYLNRPNLTEEKFIHNQFFDKANNLRLYRTGDLVRYLPNGNIEYLGRIDQQVKIRGFRIELGEIDSLIRCEEDIIDVVVIMQENDSMEKCLVAYLVNKTGIPTDEQAAHKTKQIRQNLSRKLPEYMIPTQFVYLAKLPLNANGKIDRKSLLAHKKNYRQKLYRAPQYQLEKKLAILWGQLLKVNFEEISIDDDFFELGGNSITVVQCVSRLRKEGYEINVEDIFVNKTLRLLADILNLKNFSKFSLDNKLEKFSLLFKPVPQTNKIGEEATFPIADTSVLDFSIANVLLPIQEEGTQPPLFLIHAASGLGTPYMNLVIPNQTVYALSNPYFNADKYFSSIEIMANAYIKVIKNKQAHGPYYLGGWSLGGVVALEIAQQLTQQGEKVELLVMIDSLNPTDRSERKYDFDPDAEEIIQQLAIDDEYAKAIRSQYSNANKLLEVYKPKIYKGKVVLLKAMKAEVLEENSSEAFKNWRKKIQEDLSNGWGFLMPMLIIVRLNNVSHNNLFDLEHIELVNEELKKFLTETQMQVEKSQLGFVDSKPLVPTLI